MAIVNKANIQYNDVLPDNSKTPQTKVSNSVSTEVLSQLITIVRSSASNFLLEGAAAMQTAVLTNGSSVSMTSVLYKDLLSAGASFIAGSVTINGTAYPSYDPAIGFAIPTVTAGTTLQIQYSIKAANTLTNPSVVSYATADYTVNDPIAGNVNFTAASNALTITVVSVALTIVKSVNKAFAVPSTRLHYTTVITNTGTVKKSDLIFTDAIPAGSNIVTGTVKVNGTAQPSANPAAGFALADMIPGAVTTVEFDTIVA